MEHTNEVVKKILSNEYADYPRNAIHYDREYKMMVKAIELSQKDFFEDLEHLLEWKISQHSVSKLWGCIKGKYSCTYAYMNEDKNEVLKWVSENYR